MNTIQYYIWKFNILNVLNYNNNNMFYLYSAFPELKDTLQ